MNLTVLSMDLAVASASYTSGLSSLQNACCVPSYMKNSASMPAVSSPFDSAGTESVALSCSA